MVDRLKDALLLEHLVDVTATENVVLRVRVCKWVGGRAVRKLRMRRLERRESMMRSKTGSVRRRLE